MNAPAPDTNVPVWEDGSWTPLPALAGDHETDVCVIGLGGSGLACVHELLSFGSRVIGIDAGSVACGAAGRNGGFLLCGLASFHHEAARALGRERSTALHRATRDEIRRMLAATPEAARATGSLRIAADEEESADIAAHLAAMRADDLDAEPYRGDEGEGLLLPHDAVCNPLLRCRVLARQAVAAGARLFENSAATLITPGEVRTPGGSIRCRATCVLVDGGLDRIFPTLASSARTARLQMLATTPEATRRFERPVYFRHGFEYWQQLPDGRIALGGLRDRFLNAEWTHCDQPTGELQSSLETFLRETVRSAAPVTHRWAATVGYSNRVLPWIGEVEHNVWTAGAYNGTGNVVGALCGRALARRVATGDDALLRLFSGR